MIVRRVDTVRQQAAVLLVGLPWQRTTLQRNSDNHPMRRRDQRLQ